MEVSAVVQIHVTALELVSLDQHVSKISMSVLLVATVILVFSAPTLLVASSVKATVQPILLVMLLVVARQFVILLAKTETVLNPMSALARKVGLENFARQVVPILLCNKPT